MKGKGKKYCMERKDRYGLIFFWTQGQVLVVVIIELMNSLVKYIHHALPTHLPMPVLINLLDGELSFVLLPKTYRNKNLVCI